VSDIIVRHSAAEPVNKDSVLELMMLIRYDFEKKIIPSYLQKY